MRARDNFRRVRRRRLHHVGRTDPRGNGALRHAVHGDERLWPPQGRRHHLPHRRGHPHGDGLPPRRRRLPRGARRGGLDPPARRSALRRVGRPREVDREARAGERHPRARALGLERRGRARRVEPLRRRRHRARVLRVGGRSPRHRRRTALRPGQAGRPHGSGELRGRRALHGRRVHDAGGSFTFGRRVLHAGDRPSTPCADPTGRVHAGLLHARGGRRPHRRSVHRKAGVVLAVLPSGHLGMGRRHRRPHDEFSCAGERARGRGARPRPRDAQRRRLARTRGGVRYERKRRVHSDSDRHRVVLHHDVRPDPLVPEHLRGRRVHDADRSAEALRCRAPSRRPGQRSRRRVLRRPEPDRDPVGGANRAWDHAVLPEGRGRVSGPLAIDGFAYTVGPVVAPSTLFARGTLVTE